MDYRLYRKVTKDEDTLELNYLVRHKMRIPKEYPLKKRGVGYTRKNRSLSKVRRNMARSSRRRNR
jgi:hypothetical protein